MKTSVAADLTWLKKRAVRTVALVGLVVFGSTLLISSGAAEFASWNFLANRATLLTIAAYVVGVVGVAVAFLATPEKVAIDDLKRAGLFDEDLYGSDAGDAAVETLPVGAPRTFPFKGNNLSYYEPDGVPLKILADLVNYWEQEGHTGRFMVGDI